MTFHSRLFAIPLSLLLVSCDNQGGSTNPGDAGDGGGGGGGGLQISLPDTTGELFTPKAASEHEVFVLAFWATWCQPCQQELTKMGGMYERMKDRGLHIYGISIDGPDTAAQVVPWVEREGYPFPILLDRETQVLTRFNPRGDIPYYVVLDATGKTLKDHQGYMTGDMQDLEQFLDGVLPKS